MAPTSATPSMVKAKEGSLTVPKRKMKTVKSLRANENRGRDIIKYLHQGETNKEKEWWITWYIAFKYWCTSLVKSING